MKINRELECKNFKMNSSRLLKELSSFKEVAGLGLRPDKVQTDLQLGDNMGLEQDQETTHMEVMAQGTLAEDRRKSLELLNRIIGLFQTTWSQSFQEWLDLGKDQTATQESNQSLLQQDLKGTILLEDPALVSPQEPLVLAPNANLLIPDLWWENHQTVAVSLMLVAKLTFRESL